jgi:hypothetical protein
MGKLPRLQLNSQEKPHLMRVFNLDKYRWVCYNKIYVGCGDTLIKAYSDMAQRRMRGDDGAIPASDKLSDIFAQQPESI